MRQFCLEWFTGVRPTMMYLALEQEIGDKTFSTTRIGLCGQCIQVSTLSDHQPDVRNSCRPSTFFGHHGLNQHQPRHYLCLL